MFSHPCCEHADLFSDSDRARSRRLCTRPCPTNKDISRRQTGCEPKGHHDIYTCLHLIIMVITAATSSRSEIKLRLASSAPRRRRSHLAALVNGRSATACCRAPVDQRVLLGASTNLEFTGELLRRGRQRRCVSASPSHSGRRRPTKHLWLTGEIHTLKLFVWN